jgi:hypothetical protein
MDLEMVLNELSLQVPAADIPTARKLMSELINTVRTATSHGVKKVIRTHTEFQSTILAPDYPVARWRNDNAVDREARRFFITLITKAPFLADVSDPKLEDAVSLSEFTHQGIPASGLGIAYLLETLALSLASQQCWDCSRLQMDFKQLDENGDVIEEIIEIIHASRSKHIQEHANWIQKRIRTGVKDGLELWKRREELFPNIEFCDNVSKQLQNIRGRQLELQPVVKALFELQNCCKNWSTGLFNVEGYPIEESGESEATSNKYGRERTFRCLDGKERLFERHVKLRICNWRIHLFPEKPGKIIVGYVGCHLPTVKYPT